MRICIVSPSLKMGGIERALTVLSDYFIAQGEEVTFISCLRGERFYSLPQSVQLIEPSFENSPGRLSKALFYIKLLRFLRKNISIADPDAVLVYGDIFSPVVLLSLIGKRYPVYISDRTSPDYKAGFLVRLLKKTLYPGSAGFIAQTRQAAEFKEKLFGRKLKISVIPNSIRKVELYPEIPREKIIVYLGRLSVEKGVESLIGIFNSIEDRSGWKLVLAGTGPLINGLRSSVSSLGLEKDILFPGNVSDVDSLFARSSIFALPSKKEGFPNSLCEAMAAGLPCLCFSSIPYDSFMQNGISGIAATDEAEFKKALENLMNNAELREEIGKQAIRIRELLSPSRTSGKVLDLLKQYEYIV